MKKLLLAPFLLASLFSFGSELKSDPGSRYELPDPRNSLSESQSNSKDVWYLLNQNTVQYKIITNEARTIWRTDRFAKLKIYTFANISNCRSFAANQKSWLTSIDLGRGGIDEGYKRRNDTKFRYQPYTKCIKGRNKNYANYHLEVNTFGALKYLSSDPGVIKPNYHGYINTLYFKDLSQCNLAKSQLENWFKSVNNKSLTPWHNGSFLGSSTKCISKT
tara:strand:+ start:781 stop:1437 length:657 start_codon:yes stop_codon:yes gene_type:complete